MLTDLEFCLDRLKLLKQWADKDSRLVESKVLETEIDRITKLIKELQNETR